MVKPNQNAEQVEIRSRGELRDWLGCHHGRTKGVWLVSFKKGSKHYLTYDDLVEECLCFGWVDSLPRTLDEHRSMRYIAPRKAGSAWSQRNKERVENLIRDGLMTPAGLTKVEAAKEDGSWVFLDDVEAGQMPDDLAAALASYPSARINFDRFPPSSRRLILEWIKQAKRPETRAKRIAETAAKAEDNIRANHYRQST